MPIDNPKGLLLADTLSACLLYTDIKHKVEMQISAVWIAHMLQ